MYVKIKAQIVLSETYEVQAFPNQLSSLQDLRTQRMVCQAIKQKVSKGRKHGEEGKRGTKRRCEVKYFKDKAK